MINFLVKLLENLKTEQGLTKINTNIIRGATSLLEVDTETVGYILTSVVAAQTA